jgi:5-methylcytosine-specific restriction endonuclease McrA
MEVLVLNKSYEFLQIINIRKAIRLLVKGKAEVVEPVEGKFFQTIGLAFPVPSVIRLLEMVYFKKKPVSFTRRRVFIRDKFTCQYCATKGVKMTIDHVQPQSRGGKSNWENTVAACIPCNKKKADKSLSECGMTLRLRPKQPSFFQFLRSSSALADPKRLARWGTYLYH